MEGWDGYDGTALMDCSAVTEALGRAPRRFADLIVEPGSPELALSHHEFLANVTVATTNGLSWELSLGEDMKPVIDTGPDVLDDDLLLAALGTQPGVVEAQHPDREYFDFRLAKPRRADQVLGLAIDAIAAAHRELARRLGVDLGD